MSAPARVGPRTRECADGLPGHPLDQAVVTVRMGNYSAFNGYHFTSSDYSQVVCRACLMHWRTKAAYVSMIPNGRV